MTQAPALETVTLRGHTCAYERRGDHGPRVLLVMGFGMSSDAWRRQVDALAPTCQVVRYDARGLHRSTAGDGPHDLPGLAADAAALMDHLGWEDAHVVGISMGGMIAQHLALGHRERVRSLTLVATHAGGGLRHTRPGLRGMRLFLAANTRKGEGRLEALSHLLFTEAFRAQLVRDGWSPGELRSIATPSDPSIRMAHLRSLLTHDTRPRLPSLAGLRVTVVRADHDLLVPPRLSDEIAALIPGARLVGLHAGHGVLLEAADALNALLIEIAHGG